MGKRQASTPKSKVRQALRQCWLRSREHQATLKAAARCCQRCGVKASVAKGKEVKVHVHHKQGIDWESIFKAVYATLLCPPERMEVLCESCHKKEHQD